jgi:transcription initiation factor TFIIB
MVLEDTMIDPKAEWRTFAQDGGVPDRSRVGAPVSNLLHDKGLTTDIDWQNKDFSGSAISHKYRSQMHRMRKWQKRARTKGSKERNLSEALTRIQYVCSKMNLPKSIAERSADIYRKALAEDLIRGRSIEVTAGASVFIANQQMLTARTVEDVAAVLKINPKEIGRTYRFLKRRLMIRTPPPSPMTYVSRFCSELDLNSDTENKVREIIKLAEEKELTYGKSPTGITAAALYIAGYQMNQIRTQREISDVTNVTEVTIRNRYKGLLSSLDFELEI